VMGNSHGFLGGYKTSRHSIGCAVMAGRVRRCSAITGTSPPVIITISRRR
jgi:predicted Zn-dependent protease